MDLVKAVIVFSLLFHFFSPLKINGQIKIETELQTLYQLTDTIGQKFSKPLKDASNEFEILISTGFLVYKTTISSQDKPSCIFSPSCSEYAVESFQKKGFYRLVANFRSTFALPWPG
jgi:hypothetical protein